MSTEGLPRRSARTRRFTLGAPRSFTVSPDGRRVVFLRSDHGEDPVQCLWVLDVAGPGEVGLGEERKVLDPRQFAAFQDATLPAAERARRERSRETGGGIVAYSTDRAVLRAVVVVGAQLVVVDLVAGGVVAFDVADDAFHPSLDPTGQQIAYASGGGLRVVEIGTGGTGNGTGIDQPDRELISEAGVTWGLAEFVASEEFSRGRGFWWSPDGRQIVAERVDESAVALWHMASPAEPWVSPTSARYPAAGTANADCRLAVLSLDGRRVDVEWDPRRFEYLISVIWTADSPLTVSLLSRDQRTLAVFAVDADSGAITEIHRQSDPAWVEVVPGVPAWAFDELVTAADLGGIRRVLVGGRPLGPADIHVRSVLDVDQRGVVVTASREDPKQIDVLRFLWDGTVEALTDRAGLHTAVVGGPTTVVISEGMDHDGKRVRVHGRDGDHVVVSSRAASPGFVPNVRFLELGDRQLQCALVLPLDAGTDPLPVLVDSYGGPHAQRVLRSRSVFITSQWLADQGFAVLVVDGRGTPGRGSTWEKEVRGDLATPVLEDQIDALLAAASVESRLDVTRVGIRGWSFGGYLAALAVLRRPDVFHVAVAGAPVTDWRLYDTAYTERYLGTPDEEPDNYERTDLTAMASDLRRPLMLIHGLADDNVHVAHTLQLSRALLEAGRPHTVLPLSGITHMTPQETVAENLLHIEVAFLNEVLKASK